MGVGGYGGAFSNSTNHIGLIMISMIFKGQRDNNKTFSVLLTKYFDNIEATFTFFWLHD